MILQAVTLRRVGQEIELKSYACPIGDRCAMGLDLSEVGLPPLITDKCAHMRDVGEVGNDQVVCCSHDWPAGADRAKLGEAAQTVTHYPVEEDGSSNVD